ncbi:DNA-deoxyinosine glycosylase [Chromobacterium vaccinii]|uniref:DNA-deoxyinosine glycosylase n=1 Tax=Chromobacterium vaccinii TaxID=1108595 RepID=A0A1D9LC10_9NEIS|nr:DNA-deoxyinosine glycosylase [Chromobacterium vaccinii]AOZ48714.1 DNA-deoxyinosine glycosylase [Chromobacterium vaccinii]SUX53606.1 G:T/U mismatch-specific DNA glycosylase [Chromobacterium vaccinii]
MAEQGGKRCFPPVADAGTRLLILGSLPGDASLAAGEYYAHPRNQFWRLLGEVLERDLVSLPYEERLMALRESGVGLWDVVAQASRKGSLDADLREIQHNDLSDFAASLPSLRAVAFNGATAAKAEAQLAGLDLAVARLPSSSPAHTLAYEAKLAVWRQLERYLDLSA